MGVSETAVSASPGFRLTTGNPEAIEEAIAAEIGTLQADDPLAPVGVLLGGTLQRPYLQRRLAELNGGIVNVRFMMPSELALALGEQTLVRAGKRPLPPLADRILLRQVACEHDGYFEPVRKRPGCQTPCIDWYESFEALATTPRRSPARSRAPASPRRKRRASRRSSRSSCCEGRILNDEGLTTTYNRFHDPDENDWRSRSCESFMRRWIGSFFSVMAGMTFAPNASSYSTSRSMMRRIPAAGRSRGATAGPMRSVTKSWDA